MPLSSSRKSRGREMGRGYRIEDSRDRYDSPSRRTKSSSRHERPTTTTSPSRRRATSPRAASPSRVRNTSPSRRRATSPRATSPSRVRNTSPSRRRATSPRAASRSRVTSHSNRALSPSRRQQREPPDFQTVELILKVTRDGRHCVRIATPKIPIEVTSAEPDSNREEKSEDNSMIIQKGRFVKLRPKRFDDLRRPRFARNRRGGHRFVE